MKESIKEVLLMGLGAISLTGEKANELKKELLEKGESLYKEGSIKNEELKRDIKEKIKENTNIKVTTASKEELVEIKELLKTEKESSKENTDDEDGKE